MQNLHLNPKLFEKDIEQLPIRNGFGEGLLVAAKVDPTIVGLCADLTESTKMLMFKKEFPERFVEVGVAEQNLASVASGMAAMGKLPFMTSYAMFSPGRNWEQIRTTICYNDRKVIIAGSHAGVSVGPDGGTHQAVEDIAITRVIPNLTVIVPCDAIEAKKATIAAAKTAAGTGGQPPHSPVHGPHKISEQGVDTPVYIRLAREKSPVITTEETPFAIGKAQVFFELDTDQFITLKSAKGGEGAATFKLNSDHDIRHDVGVVACGALVHKAITVAKKLEAEGVAVKVLNLSTIKPLDIPALVALAKETGAIVTVEEHQIAGGVGSAVAEAIVQNLSGGDIPPFEFVGVRDVFGQSGTPEEVIQHYGMGEDHIEEAVRKVITRKK